MMRALSGVMDRNIVVAWQLASRKRWPWGRSSIDEQINSILRDVGRSGEPLAIPRFIALCLDERIRIAEAAALAVAELLGSVTVRDLIELDLMFRKGSACGHECFLWRDMGPKVVARLSYLENGAAVVQCAMSHPDGYVREEAIRRSSICADGRELQFLLLRLNDWVQSVRQAAGEALRARLSERHIPDLIDALPLLERMRGWGRMHDEAVVAAIHRLLDGPAGETFLLAACRSERLDVRRAAVRRLGVRGGRHQESVLAAALADTDASTGLWAAGMC